MTNTNVGADKKAIIPSITGYPMLDTVIRALLTSAAAAITTLILKHLDEMGYHQDPDRALEIGAAVMTALIGAATVGWSLVQTHLNKNSVVNHTIDALATGEVSDAVRGAAIKAPQISDEKIVKAAEHAEVIKSQQ